MTKDNVKKEYQKMEKRVVEVCKFKPTIKQVEGNTADSQSCHYYMQKYEALVSKHSLWNYHAFFTIMKFNKKIFEEYLDRKVTIFDEAHKIEDQIIQFVGFDIFSGQVDECNLNSEKYNLIGFGLHDPTNRRHGLFICKKD